MIKSRVASIEEIHANNPRLCLSALRYLGHCWKCPNYASKAGKPCNSRIVSEEGEAKLKAIIEKKNKIKEVKAELKKIQGGIE